jgi:hypothetical protein
MKKGWLGIFLLTVLAATALIVCGAVGADRPDAAAEAPFSAEPIPELLKGSADSTPQGPAVTLKGGAIGHFPPFFWHCGAPHFRLPSVPLCFIPVQPRSPPHRVDRPI